METSYVYCPFSLANPEIIGKNGRVRPIPCRPDCALAQNDGNVYYCSLNKVDYIGARRTVMPLHVKVKENEDAS